MKVVESFDVMVVDMCFVKFFDEVLVCELVGSYELLVIIEENVVMGGVGLVVGEFFVSEGFEVLLL